jgi:hypothetical protein
MTRNTGANRSFIKRCLAVVTMLGLYCLATLSVSGLVLSTTSTTAEAQRGGRGGGPGGGRGMRGGRGRGGVVRARGGRGRGRGRGFFRGGIWYPWFGPGICIHPWTGARVFCPLY